MSYYDSYLYPKDEDVITKRLSRVIEQIQDQIDRAPLNIDSDNDEYNPTPYLEPFGGGGGTTTSDASNQKEAVRAATTANITLSGTQTIDGVALVADDRVLVKDQTDGTANGIYIVKSGAWTRATDTDSDAEILNMTVLVTSGDTYDNLSFLCTNDSITLGTTALEFAEYGSNYTDVDVLAYLNTLLADGWTDITNFIAATEKWWTDSTDAAIAFVKGLATDGIAALNAFITWLGSSTDIIDKIWDQLKTSYNWLENTLQPIVDEVWDSLKTSYTWLENGVVALANNVWDQLKTSYTWLENGIVDLANNVWDQLKTSYNWLENTLQPIVDEVWDSLKTSYTWLENGVVALANNVWDQLKISYNWLSDTISGVVSEVQANLGQTWTDLNNLWDGLSSAVQTGLSDALTWLENTLYPVKTALTTAIDWVTNAPAKIYNILSSGATTLTSSFLGAAQSILFGGATPSAFAESEADGQITSSLNSTNAGTIGKKIVDDLTSSFRSFGNEIGGLTISAGRSLANIFSDIIDRVITGISGTDGRGQSNADGGNIDMKTWDITNVDRLYFNSNDNPIVNNDDRPVIAGFLENMWFGVGDNHDFQYYIDSVLTFQVSKTSNTRYINFVNHELRNLGYKTITRLTELSESNLDDDDDYLMILDDSSNAIKKIKPSALGGSGGGISDGDSPTFNDLTISDDIEIDGDLNHDGSRFGIRGLPPVGGRTWLILGNVADYRQTIDVTSASDHNTTNFIHLVRAFKTLVEDLKEQGILI